MSKVFRSFSAPIPAPSKPPAGCPSVCFAPAISIWPLSLWILALAASEALAATQTTGTISGRIEDATGASIPGTTITVKNLETGATRSVVTGDSGAFRVLSLPIGPQELKAERLGFKTAVRSGIDLAVGQEVVVNLRLEVGEYTDRTVIVVETPLVNTTTSP